MASDEPRSESYEAQHGAPFLRFSRWEKGQVYGCQTEDKIDAKLGEYLS